MEKPEEKKAAEITKDTKIKVPLSLVVSACVASVLLGGTMNEVLNNDQQRVEVVHYLEEKINELKDFLVGEVQGLRGDWERRNKDVEKRLDKLEQKK